MPFTTEVARCHFVNLLPLAFLHEFRLDEWSRESTLLVFVNTLLLANSIESTTLSSGSFCLCNINEFTFGNRSCTNNFSNPLAFLCESVALCVDTSLLESATFLLFLSLSSGSKSTSLSGSNFDSSAFPTARFESSCTFLVVTFDLPNTTSLSGSLSEFASCTFLDFTVNKGESDPFAGLLSLSTSSSSASTNCCTALSSLSESSNLCPLARSGYLLSNDWTSEFARQFLRFCTLATKDTFARVSTAVSLESVSTSWGSFQSTRLLGNLSEDWSLELALLLRILANISNASSSP